MDQINTQPVPTTQIVPPAKSGLLRWILVAGIVVVSIGGIVAYTLIRKATNTSTVVSNYSVSPSAVPVVTGEIAKTNNLTGKNQYEEPPITLYPGAKVYTSQKWGIRFQYPASKQIEITEPDRLSEDGLLNEAIAINVTQASRDALSNATLFAYYIRTMPNDSSRSFDDNLRSYFVNRINFNDCSIVTPKQKLIKSPGEERYIAPTTSDGIVNYCGNVGVYGMGRKREISSWKDASTYFVLPSNNSSYIYVIDGGYVYGGSEGVLGLDSVWQDTIEFLPKKKQSRVTTQKTDNKSYVIVDGFDDLHIPILENWQFLIESEKDNVRPPNDPLQKSASYDLILKLTRQGSTVPLSIHVNSKAYFGGAGPTVCRKYNDSDFKIINDDYLRVLSGSNWSFTHVFWTPKIRGDQFGSVAKASGASEGDDICFNQNLIFMSTNLYRDSDRVPFHANIDFSLPSSASTDELVQADTIVVNSLTNIKNPW